MSTKFEGMALLIWCSEITLRNVNGAPKMQMQLYRVIHT